MIGIKVQTLLLFIFFTSLLVGQNSHPHFRNYSTNDGLPSSEVYTAFEDSQGYIWFGTDNGVSRFNGYEFENFGVKEGLLDNVVFHIREDKGGKVWMNTMSGKLYYYWDGVIYPYQYNYILAENKDKIITPTSFHFTEQNELFIGLRGWGILKIDATGDYSLLNEGIDANMFFTEVDGQIIYASISAKLLSDKFRAERLRTQENIYCLIKKGTHLLLNNPIKKGITNNFRAFKYGTNFGLMNREKLTLVDTNLQVIESLPIPLPVAAIIPDKTGEIWVGLIKGNGIQRYQDLKSLQKNQFEAYLSGVSISWVMQDRSGGYWLTSLENGLYYCPALDFQVYDESSGLSGSHITVITPKTDTSFFIGLRNGAIYEYDLILDRILEVKKLDKQDEIHDLLYITKTQTLWKAGTTMDYLKDGKWFSIFNKQNKLNIPLSAKNLAVDRDDKYVWGCYHAGFYIINSQLGQLKYSSNETIPARRTLATFEDKNGRNLIGNVDGLFEFKNQQLLPIQPVHPIFKFRIEAITELSKGEIVLGTKGGGVAIWSTEKIVIIDEEKGLSTNMIENLYVDASDNIWVSTLAGLNKITVSDQLTVSSVSQFTLTHGLPSNEINGVLAIGDHTWVATKLGLIRIPLKENTNEATYKPVLQKALVNNQKTNPTIIDRYPYQSNNWQFNFFSPNYKFPGKIPYRYRIQTGETWTMTTNNVINFAKLSPGEYQFEVQAQNEDGFWSDSLLIPFTINTPFWMSLWFIALSISILVGGIILFFQRRVNRVQQEAKVQQEINTLKRAALQAQMNPHFIFNCLNSIQQFIAVDDKKNALHYLSRFAQLIRSTLNASLATTIPLEDEIEMLRNYLELEKARFGNKFNFHISVDDALETFEVEIPPLLIQPYVENAIIHGLANLEQPGKLDINYSLKENRLLVTITDNGVGIFHSQELKKGKKNLKKSLGMGITRKRLNLIQPNGARDSEVQIIERQSQEGKILGTTIKLEISIEREGAA